MKRCRVEAGLGWSPCLWRNQRRSPSCSRGKKLHEECACMCFVLLFCGSQQFSSTVGNKQLKNYEPARHSDFFHIFFRGLGVFMLKCSPGLCWALARLNNLWHVSP
eukprot:6472520-Amphidinium_carterae.2